MKFSNTEIENLAQVLKQNNLGSVSYEEDGCKITLSNEASANVMSVTKSTPEVITEAEVSEDSFTTEIIKCPLVGHFYLTPSPGSDPYVAVGSVINSGDVIGILQAMKVSNEIKSEISGEVIEIFAENGQFVDFDAPLFKVRV